MTLFLSAFIKFADPRPARPSSPPCPLASRGKKSVEHFLVCLAGPLGQDAVRSEERKKLWVPPPSSLPQARSWASASSTPPHQLLGEKPTVIPASSLSPGPWAGGPPSPLCLSSLRVGVAPCC